MNNKKLNRILRGYKKQGEEILVEISLEDVPLIVIQRCFDIPEENPMYDSYKVGQEHVATLQKYISKQIEFDKYDFYIECESE